MGAGPVGAGPVRLPVQTHGGARGRAGEPATVTRRLYKENTSDQIINPYK